MYLDKQASKTRNQRIPEKYLMLLAICLGSIGIYLGMKKPINHKSLKPLFKIGVPLIILIQGFIFVFYII
jgi:uncharacterized membrane protein YsdA (DUF1294 family)